jgi:hypothetical protein
MTPDFQERSENRGSTYSLVKKKKTPSLNSLASKYV